MPGYMNLLSNTPELCLNTFRDGALVFSEKLSPLQSRVFYWINICPCPLALMFHLGAEWDNLIPLPWGHRPGHCTGCSCDTHFPS